MQKCFRIKQIKSRKFPLPILSKTHLPNKRLRFWQVKMDGGKKQIVSSRIQKLGLALARFSHYIHSGRIQIAGQSEIFYLLQFSEQRIEALNNLKPVHKSKPFIHSNLRIFAGL
jgi:serine kinase of HPr protein (carbohydrate metabolism regulator)